MRILARQNLLCRRVSNNMDRVRGSVSYQSPALHSSFTRPPYLFRREEFEKHEGDPHCHSVHRDMRISSPEVTRALVAELKSLREKHLQFQARVKEADKAARVRDEETRKKNEFLTERIIGLENDLDRARQSIEVCLSFSVLPWPRSSMSVNG